MSTNPGREEGYTTVIRVDVNYRIIGVSVVFVHTAKSKRNLWKLVQCFIHEKNAIRIIFGILYPFWIIVN